MERKKALNTILGLLAAGVMLLSMTACKASQPSCSNEPLDRPIAGQPVLLTSAGQSIDAEIVAAMLDELDVEYVLDNRAREMGAQESLLLVMGASQKGLSGQGRTVDEELDRVTALIASAQGREMPIIALSIGGKARRGLLSDRFLAPCIAASEYVAVVKDSDRDQKVSQLAAEAEVTLAVVEDLDRMEELIRAAYLPGNGSGED